MKNRTISAATAALLLSVALSACAARPGDADPAPSSPPPETAPSASSAPVVTTPTETPAADPTCETIVTAGTVEGLSAQGWTPQRKDFAIGDVALPDGMLCFWADYSEASDHGQLYGWAAISAEDAASAEASLIAEGWTREDSAEGLYITEDPRFSLGVDDDGYGMTYLFGDGWVKVADTKQSLILVDWAG